MTLDIDTIEQITIAIGHHFWKCESDQDAYDCGRDCMNDILKRLEEEK